MVISVTFNHDTPIVNTYIGKPEAGSAIIKCEFNTGWPWTEVEGNKQVLITSKDKFITKLVNPSNLCFSVPMGTVCNGHNPVSFIVYGYTKDGIKKSARPFTIEIYSYGYTPSSESHTFEELDARLDLVENTLPTKISKVSNPTENNLATLDATGSVKDSGIANNRILIKGNESAVPAIAYDLIMYTPDESEDTNHVIGAGISADSVTQFTGASTADNIILSATTGTVYNRHTVKDSGISKNSLAIKEFGYDNTKVNKLVATSVNGNGRLVASSYDCENIVYKTTNNFSQGNVIEADSSGVVRDSGLATTNIMTKSGTSTADNIPKYDSTGALVDSGILSTSIAQVSGSLPANYILVMNSSGKLESSGITSDNVAQKSGTLTTGHLTSISGTNFVDSGIVASNVIQRATAALTSGALVKTDENGKILSAGIYTEEQFIFTLADGTTVTKSMLVKA